MVILKSQTYIIITNICAIFAVKQLCLLPSPVPPPFFQKIARQILLSRAKKVKNSTQFCPMALVVATSPYF